MRAGAFLIAALAGAVLVAPPRVRAAFESPAPDPRLLALGYSGPAWPLDGGVPAPGDGAFVIGEPPRTGVSVSSLRWDAAPDLRKDGLTAWLRRSRVLGAARITRLTLPGYSETSFLLSLARPAAERWGWGVSAGRESWSVSGRDGLTGWLAIVEAGFRPPGGAGFAVALEERFGATQASATGAVRVGMAAELLPGWRAGAGYETSRAGGFGRFQLGVECRTRVLALRLGLEPSHAAVAFGVGLRRGLFGLDVARRNETRLGAVQAFAVTAGGGGD